MANINRYDLGTEAEQLNDEYYALDEMIASAESLKEDLDYYWNEFKVSLSYAEEVDELIWYMRNRQEEVRDRLGEIEANAPREYGEL